MPPSRLGPDLSSVGVETGACSGVWGIAGNRAGVRRGSWPLSSPRLWDCAFMCWICSLDGALPLGQEALISCGGDAGRIRSGGLSSGPSLMLLFGTKRGRVSA